MQSNFPYMEIDMTNDLFLLILFSQKLRTAVMISCRNLNGGFRNNLSVSAGFLINFPSESCVRFIVISLTSAILSQRRRKKKKKHSHRNFLIFLSLNV